MDFLLFCRVWVGPAVFLPSHANQSMRLFCHTAMKRSLFRLGHVSLLSLVGNDHWSHVKREWSIITFNSRVLKVSTWSNPHGRVRSRSAYIVRSTWHYSPIRSSTPQPDGLFELQVSSSYQICSIVAVYKRAATNPTAIKRPPTLLAPAAPVKGTVLLFGDTG